VFESLLIDCFGFGSKVRARSSILFFCASIVFTAVVVPVRGSKITYIYDGPFRSIPADTGSNIGPMDDAVIDVNEHLIIADLDVAIDIVHTCSYDLEIILQGPTGLEIYLNAYDDEKQFFGDPNYSQTIFDDEAFTPIEQGDAPFIGSYRPKSGNFLSTFDDTDAYGAWRLKINDLYYYDSGYLENFELRITIPEPATFVFFTLAGLLLRRRG